MTQLTSVQTRQKSPNPTGGSVRLQRKCACGQHMGFGGECDSCKKKRLQRKVEDSSELYAVPPIVYEVLHSSGQPLDRVTRAYMEPRFSQDFSGVRLHTDARAAEAARAVNAQAYTVGQNIVFGKGQYAVGSERGNQLLAHELTHVVQQQRGLSSRRVSISDDPAEREADLNARRVNTGHPLKFESRPSMLSRRAGEAGETTTTVVEPTGPNACRLEHHRVIAPAVSQAQQWLERAVSRLDAYIRAPANAANANVREALDRHFHATDVATARLLRTRLNTIHNDLTSRDPFTTECHTSDDASCTNSGAYIPGENQSMVVFCPGFFESSSENWRAGALIHEFAHALLGLSISDRAYENDRVLPFLSTAEALDNAESHTQFAEELATGQPVRGNPPQDTIEDCTSEAAPLIREALGRAQRWNRDAETVANDSRPDMISNNADLFTTHLGDASPATRAAASRIFSDMVVRLQSPIDVRCDSRPQNECSSRQAYKRAGSSNLGLGAGIGAAIGGGLGLVAGLVAGFLASSGPIGLAVGLGVLALGTLIGLITGAATSTTDTVHICPTWQSQSDPALRTESLLAAIYETYAGLNVDQSQRYARLARAIHERYIGPPETP